MFRGRRVAYRTRHLLAVTPVPKPVCLCSRRPQFPFEDAREYALGTATLLYGDRRPIVSHPEGRLPVSPVRYLAPTEGPLHAYRAASPKDENQPAAKGGAGCGHSSVRRRSGEGICAPRLPSHAWGALRRSRRRSLSRPNRCHEAAILGSGCRKVRERSRVEATS